VNLTERCKAEFDSTTRARGQSYFHAGLVKVVNQYDDVLEALVAGSAPEPYAVSIDWHAVQNRELCVSCSCPRMADGVLCKHIWATLLAMDASGTSRQVSGRWSLSVYARDEDWDEDEEDECYDEDDEYYDEEEYGENNQYSFDGRARYGDAGSAGILGEVVRQLVPHLPSPPRSRGRRAVKPPDWHHAFDTLCQERDEDGDADPWHHFQRRDRLAWYGLSVSQSAAEGELVITLLQQMRMKNGELGKVKTLNLDTRLMDDFTDASDRRLLPQLCVLNQGLQSYRSYYGYGYGTSVSEMVVPPATYELLLPQLAATGRFRWSLDNSSWSDTESIAWDAGEPWTFQIVIAQDDAQQRWNVTGQFARGAEVRPMSDVVLFLPTGLVLFRNLLSRAPGRAARWIDGIYRHSPITVPYAQRDEFLRALWSAPALPPVVWPENLAIDQVRQPPQPRLRVRASKYCYRGELEAQFDFLYGDTCVTPQDEAEGVLPAPAPPGPITQVLLRDREAEQSHLAELGKLPISVYNPYGSDSVSLRLKAKHLPAIVDQLVARGWRVEADGKVYRTAGNFQIKVQSGINWFDLEASMDFGGVEAPLPDLLAALRRGQNYVELGDGSWGLLPEDWLKRYTSLADLGEATDGKVRFVRSQALLLDALLAEQEHTRVDRGFEEYRQRLRSFSGIAPHDPPASFQGQLRDYQRHGLGWLHFLRDLELGGCLADDMGLGKTVQVLALLEERRSRRLPAGDTRRPSLVVVPKSLVFNWIDEAQRFTPQLRVFNYTGTQRNASPEQLESADVVVTTYGTLRRDIVQLKQRSFDYVILDEAQSIKNGNSQMAKAALLLQAQHRLALSGTPIENHLGELWSLFEFLNPGMLGRSSAFAALCRTAKADDHESLLRLARAVAPFILRRTKEQVLHELPAKTEQTLYCELPPKERKEYDQLREYYRTKLATVIDQRGLKQSKIHVLEALLRLRQAACHPGLLDPKRAGTSSAKLDTLLEQLEEVIGEGHKALVFSQFTSLLAIVRKRLDKASISYQYLDGKSRDRKSIVTAFQNDDSCRVFLISLKAGGHGLNLTAADYVFILDPWWNPAVEMQAIDRTHRIGQTRRVFAYRIIARDTVEEKVLALQNGKRDLANAIVTANDSLIRKLTVEDLQLILS
jgi:superfamily II DNA or RNA helicase